MSVAKLMRMICLAITLLTSINHAQAEDTSKPNMLIYINPQEYTNQIKLWHYYYDYWFAQGPIVEKVAKVQLEKEYGTVSMCEGNQSGKTLVWLQPSMFYNPQSLIYYGKIKANVYTGVGKLLGEYVGESKKHGYLDVQNQKSVYSAYDIAMQNAISKMKADPALQAIINKPAPASSTDTPCSMVTLLPTPKVRAMSF
ncbi:MAG: hypothetical protein WBL28_09325 [Methylotenera sp.]